MRTAGTSPEPFYFFKRTRGVQPLAYRREVLRITDIFFRILKRKDIEELLFVSVILDAFVKTAQKELQNLLNQEKI
ncbi:MAG: hypothetical protein MUC49_14045 [Raineya sp.]|jgi:hypothetical protein|nr:hypothetical protein [Raineya sp.]